MNTCAFATDYEKMLDANSITSREFEVISLVAKGYSNKEVADELSLTPNTIKNHVSRVLKKLGLFDRTQLVIMMLGLGWANIDESTRIVMENTRYKRAEGGK